MLSSEVFALPGRAALASPICRITSLSIKARISGQNDVSVTWASISTRK
jgi:hypothetical protein